ncbi:exonuclease domain-containing protein [Mucilaginibacter arboris]|uniref:DNA polymerase III subunit epsilon n=1 Tax=Mucilaginibacter arboris TaxID=2682090 RepID=A0A7K1STB6_9SPHI|nr:exonuclease domain-containing protein [Mucilaginibacter arboris]MVN20541.1 DNA polymerase III subunit epsilon [Mucilaginibacter arboris]
MYAIVDIETTGGHASANGITDIAIVLHDGVKVYHRFQSLINPQQPIPVYIQALTGINNDMVKEAPTFAEVAGQIYDLLQDKIFIAHNVNFDYSFVRYHLEAAGFNLQCKKLCTVRLSRKILPGYPSYSLGKLCHQLGIENESRHRAMGDAFATSALFSMLLKNDQNGHIQASLLQKSKEQLLPPNLLKNVMDMLPKNPGVYYFHDQKGKVIYVGKAKNIKKRVNSHFTGNNPNKQRQNFLKGIYNITWQVCGTELMALILEAAEIKRLWPAHNRALKRFDHAFALYQFEDQNGYLRLAIGKKKKYNKPIYTFGLMPEGYGLLRKLMIDFNLCPKLCFLQQNGQECLGIEHYNCLGACEGKEPATDYNLRVVKAVEHLHANMPTFIIYDEGREAEEQSLILMEEGQFYGMGYTKENLNQVDLKALKDSLSPISGNDYIKNLVYQFAKNNPEKTVTINV